MKRVLVTGATGFVGACLARRLVSRGHEVHILLRSTSDTWRIEDLLDDLVIHEADLCDGNAVERAVSKAGPEAVFHLATYGGFASERDTSLAIEANLLGTANLLRACQQEGFECFVNTGSSSEYGVKTGPMKETDPLEPDGAYAVTKAAATLFCAGEASRHGEAVITLRLFSPYGPWDDPRRMIPYVMKSLLNGERPRLFTPSAVRDYILIDDVVDAYESVLGARTLPGDVINVGSGVQHTVGAVVQQIIVTLGSDIEPEWETAAPPRQEPENWVADVSKAASLLGWRPSTSLADGLAATAGWMREHLDRYR